jgi:hypothetical protein
MTRRAASVLAFVATLLGGCSQDSHEAVELRTPMPATLAGVYTGKFPCSNCAEIEATLWLRPDGGFILRQRLIDDPAAPSDDARRGPSTTYGLGRWSWDELSSETVLRGRGPERRLAARGDGELQLRAASPTKHILERLTISPPFGDRLMLEGESAVTETAGTFKECSTGLTFAVAEAGAFRELKRQHRRMNPRGKVALTTIEGHLVTGDAATTSERLVVDAFVSIKPGTSC